MESICSDVTKKSKKSGLLLPAVEALLVPPLGMVPAPPTADSHWQPLLQVTAGAPKILIS
jgi:hypothetical protein